MSKKTWLNKNLKSVKTDGWFSPSQPIDAVAQEKAQGRQFAFPVGSNLQYTPRQNDPVTFSQLRQLADSLDILRAVIETRKDQLIILDYDFVMKDGSDNENDTRCKELREFFAFPDKENDWATWLRMILEDLFVIDAPCLYVNKTLGGDIYGLEIVDGSAIKVLIDDKGRSPNPPDASYQAVFYGVPATDYTKDELIYKPRNKRSNKVYGFSPVEQILMTVNIALRRQVAQLQYYTEGNIPSAIMSTPENWTLENIKLFQEYWDSILEGNTAKRRHAIFTPHGVTVNPTHENPLSDQFDEWIARIVCYVFSVSPQAFAKQANRATAEVNKQTADEEGILPLKIYVKSLMDYIINRFFGYKDIEFSFVTEVSVDPTIQATIDDINIKNGSTTIDEVRQQRGQDPLPKSEEVPEEKLNVNVNEDASNTNEKITKSAKTLQSDIEEYFDVMANDVAKQVKNDDLNDADQLISDLNFVGYAQLLSTIKTEIITTYTEEYKAQEIVTKAEETATEAEIKLRARTYAKNRAAELVTKLDESTRNFLRADIAMAIDNGLTPDELADELEKNYAFSTQRAKTIATYELSTADTNAKIDMGKTNPNVIGKRYVKVGSSKSKQCDICDQAVAMGVVSLDSNFNSIGDAPAHPNCTHRIELVLKDTK